MSPVDGSAKRGPKERIGLKSMTVEERREYDRTRQKLHRLQKKQNEVNEQQSTTATSTEQTPDETEECSSDDEIDFCTGNTAAAAAIIS